MPQGIKALRRVQLGKEITPGTQAAATNILIGEGTLQDTREVVFQKGDVGAFLGNQNTRTAKLGGQLDFSQEATFEQFPYVLNASVNVSTADKDGAGSGYVYYFPMATTAPITPLTYTIEAGDNITTDAEFMPYCYVSEWTLSGKGSEPLQLDATWKGRKVSLSSDDGFTAGIAVPNTEAILFSRGALYIDDSSSAIGQTLRSNTLLGMELKYASGLQEVWTADNLTEPTFSFIKQTAPGYTLKITFEHDDISSEEKAAWRAETPQRLRLKFPGSALTTGTAWDSKMLQVDMYGKWIQFDKLDEQDGNDILAGTFVSLYDSTGTSLACDITVVNALNGLL